MAKKIFIEAFNSPWKDLRSSNQLFGDVTFLFAGDFRQILQVIIKGKRADVVNACLKSSAFWIHKNFI